MLRNYPRLLHTTASLLTLAFSSAASCLAQAAAAVPEAPAPDVWLTTRPNPVAPEISPLLGGSQFNFFNGPIRERRDSQALLDDWKGARIGALRYPGGTWGDHYVWDHPEKSYFVAGESAQTIITPAQFIALCRKVGAEPIFQANALVRGEAANNWINPTKIGDIREGARWTAEWVRQANIVNGWKVKYWEVGNELWIMKLAPRGVLSLLAAPSMEADNWDSWNQDAHPVDILDSAVSVSNGALEFELPAHSVAGITIAKAG